MILVTGITSKTGRWFLNRLVEKKRNDLKIKIVVRKESTIDFLDNIPLNIEINYGDLHNENYVNKILKDVTTVLHIAGIGMSLNIVKAALKHNVKRLILVHTTGIYSKFKSANKEYLTIEKEIDLLLKDKNINLNILRPTMIYGSMNDNNMIVFIKLLDKFKIIPVINKGKYLLQPVYAKDLGYAYYDVLINEENTRNKNYILSGKEPIYLIDVFKTISEMLHKKRYFISVPFSLAYFMGWSVFILSFGKIDYREKIQRLIEDRAYPHDEAKKDFGYSPISFQEGIKIEIDEYLARKNPK